MAARRTDTAYFRGPQRAAARTAAEGRKKWLPEQADPRSGSPWAVQGDK